MTGDSARLDLAAVLPHYPSECPALFEDERGEDEFSIHNDGHELRTTLRGVALEGPCFDALAAHVEEGGVELPLATDKYGYLNLGTLTVVLGTGTVVAGSTELAHLEARIVLEPVHVDLNLQLADGREFQGTGWGGDFEAELDDLRRTLPADVQLLNCHSCGLSDYSPSGKQVFGDLSCFRGAKTAYKSVTSKWDLFELWPRQTESVQETHLCPEWESRPAGRGYRG